MVYIRTNRVQFNIFSVSRQQPLVQLQQGQQRPQQHRPQQHRSKQQRPQQHVQLPPLQPRVTPHQQHPQQPPPPQKADEEGSRGQGRSQVKEEKY